MFMVHVAKDVGKHFGTDPSNLSYRNPLERSTNSDLHTAARRESTVSWLADSTQLSMGRSMQDDDMSL